jgi:hypothetical protein
MRVVLELIALAEHQELRKTNLIDLRGQVSPRVNQGIRMALDHFSRPLEVIGTVILRLQGTEQSIVFQPTCVLGAELVICRPQVLALSGFKVCPHLFEQPLLERNN